MDDTSTIEFVFRSLMNVGVSTVFPILTITFVVAIIVGAFMAMTQINEQTITFTPKLLVVAAILAILGGTMFDRIVTTIRETILMATSIF